MQNSLPSTPRYLRLFALLLLLSTLLFTSACGPRQVEPSPEIDGAPRIEAKEEYSRAMLGPDAGLAASAAPRAIGYAVLYYIPNRILDLIDIFRVDVGIGVSFGAVVRLTRYGQVGYRGFAPRSFRIGLRGRRSPIFLERYPEYGFGPGFKNTGARLPSRYEIGAGADALLVGAYAGISLDELLDFLGGLVFLDFKGDDLNFR